MDTKYLKTLKTILEDGSFQNAAHRLGYTQSTITFHVQQLEQEYGLQLFERIGRKMVPTQACRDILPHIDDVLAAQLRIENYGKEANQMGGELKIAMPEILLLYRLQSVLKTFQAMAPQVNISLRTHNCRTTTSLILKGEIDAGLHFDVAKYDANVIAEEYGTFPLALVAAGQGAVPASMQELGKHTLLLPIDEDNPIREKLAEQLVRHRVTPTNVIELGSFEAIKQSAIGGVGIACLPRFMMEDALADGRLRELNLGMRDMSLRILCAYHKNKWMSPAMALFIRLIKEHVAQNAA